MFQFVYSFFYLIKIADYEGLSYTNEERMQFVQKIINSMNVGDNIVFLGHSRGTENALRLAAKNPVRSW